jgi:hypothetical protein
MRSRRVTILTVVLAFATVTATALPAQTFAQTQDHGETIAQHGSGPTLLSRDQAPDTSFPVTDLGQSGIAGTARLTTLSADRVAVEVAVNGAGAEPRPIHIHEGACADLNPVPEIPLTTVVNGASTTEVDVSLQQLTSTPHAIFLHKSAVELPIFVACADIMPARHVAAMPATGEGYSDVGLAAGLFGVGCALVAMGCMLRRRGQRAWATRVG